MAGRTRQFVPRLNPNETNRLARSDLADSRPWLRTSVAVAWITVFVLGARQLSGFLGRGAVSRDTKLSPVPYPTLARVQFTVPDDDAIPARVVFHFEGLGYHGVGNEADSWTFERGGFWAGFWSFDIREYYTVLTIRRMRDPEVGCRINCWQVRTLGTIIFQKDTRRLEQEGRDLAVLLGSRDLALKDG